MGAGFSLLHRKIPKSRFIISRFEYWCYIINKHALTHTIWMKTTFEILNDFCFATLISDHNHILDWDMMIAYANRILTKMALYIWLCVYTYMNVWKMLQMLHRIGKIKFLRKCKTITWFFCMCFSVCKKCRIGISISHT